MDCLLYDTVKYPKRISTVNREYNLFYIECDLLKQYPYTMKLKLPLDKHYDCKIINNCKIINRYKEENFEEKDDYVIVSYEAGTEDEEICFDIKYN